MKLFLIVFLAATALVQQNCNKRSAKTANCFKGRLEIKGICSNYTISVLEGNLAALQTEASWTDENTGKTYQKVFALGNPCSFPASIAEGQTFYFTTGEKDENCVVCQAYYPKPSKAMAIQVLDKPCP